MRDFDDIIRGKLEGLRLDANPDWDGMQQRLDEEVFDESLRSALPGGMLSSAAFGSELPESQWDELAQRLDANAEIEADVFDRLIANRMAHAESSFEPSESWRQLSRRMDTLWPLRKLLVRYRVPELAAAALFLFTFLPLLKDNATWERLTGRESSELAEQGTNDTVELSKLADLNGNTSSLGGNANAEGVPPSDFAGVANPLVLSPQEIAALLAHHETGLAPAAKPVARARTVQDFVPGLALLSRVWEQFTQSDLSSAQQGAQAFVVPTIQPAAALSTPAANPLSADYLDTKPLKPLALLEPKLALPKTTATAINWNYGVSGGLSLIRIVTPVDPLFDAPSRKQQLSVPFIGMHASYDVKPRMRLGLSASILSPSYDPGLPEVVSPQTDRDVNSGFKEDFRTISFDVVRGVADVRLGLVPKVRKVQVWAKAGLGTQMVLRTSYDVQREVATASFSGIPESSASSALPGFGPRQPKSATPIVRTATPAEVRNLPNGLLQRGNFRENSQWFARIGLETELRLGSKIRVFGAADFDAALAGQRGFGPNKDRFYGLHTEVGARVNL